jgi:peptidoglycan/xylan/chitin deacetylase (PgdA/CDA1 family)
MAAAPASAHHGSHRSTAAALTGVLLVLCLAAPAAASPEADARATTSSSSTSSRLITPCPPPIRGVLREHRGSRNAVAFTFDDGPHPVNTPEVLDMLRRNNVKATFFIIGRNGERRPGLLRRIVEEGHVLANHTYTHPHARSGPGYIDDLPRELRAREMDEATRVIRSTTGITPCFYRSPGGHHHSALTQQLANDRRMTVTHWTVNSLDSRQPPYINEAFIRDAVTRTTDRSLVRPILIWHDGGGGFRGNTIIAAERSIATYRRRGYAFVDPAGRPIPTLDRTVSGACPAKVRFTRGFSDVSPTHPHLHAIVCAARRGVVSGRTSTTFAPQAPITREQAASMLHRLLTDSGYDLSQHAPVRFRDVSGVHRRAIEQLAGAGIIEGHSDGTFGPRERIRRDQMSSLLMNALELAHGLRPPMGRSFPDVSGDSVHATSVRRLTGAGITQGVTSNRFAPGAAVSRAQMTTFTMRTESLLIREGRTQLPDSLR